MKDSTSRKLEIDGQRGEVESPSGGPSSAKGWGDWVSDGIFSADIRGRFLDVNPYLCRMLGYEQTELLEVRIQDLFVDEDFAKTLRFDEYEPGKTYFLERPLRRVDGSPMLAEISIKRLSRNRLLGIVRDLAEGLADGRLVPRSSNVVRVLLERLPDGVSLIVGGEIVFANAALAHMYGYSRNEIVGKSPPDFLTPEEIPTALGRIKDLMEGGSVYPSEFLCLRADGTLFPIEITSRVLDIDGAPAILSIHHDLTDRKKTEEDLRKTNETLKALIEACPLSIVAVDGEGRVTMWNPASERIFGWDKGEVLGYFPPNLSEDGARTMLERIRQGAAIEGVEVSRLRRDGSVVDLDFWTAPLRDGKGTITGSVGLGADITERKRLEREILEVSAREQSRIGQDLHDDLGQRLAGIAFLSQALAQRLASSSSSEAAAAAEIVKLANQATAQARNLARVLHPIVLEDGLESALKELGSNMERLYGISCNVHMGEDLPEIDDATRRHLYYVAQEAVTNAVKHGRAKNVSVRLARYGDRCKLFVRDDGAGLSKQPNTSNGMGLHIMRYRAHMIHASFSIRPGEDGGTVVRLSWPSPKSEKTSSKI
jgi:PAS domain S-box-containing protein